MKHAFLFIFSLIFFVFSVSAQSGADQMQKFREETEKIAEKAKTDTGWTVTGSFSVTANAIMLQNWQAGGADVASGAAIFNITPIYNHGRSSLVTNLVMAYGLNRQDGVTFKMDDRIDFQTNYNYRFGDNWNVSSLVSFRTQFYEGEDAPGSNNIISNFMAPAYLVYGLGITYKPSNRLVVYMSPATAKHTFVFNDSLSQRQMYGLANPGDRHRFEAGAYVNIFYREKLNDKINFQTRLDLFSNYSDVERKPQNLDVNAEILFFWKINKFLSFNVALNLIYDEDIMIPVERADGSMGQGPRTQLKSVLGAGFAWTF